MSPSEFATALLNARNIVHLMHLATTSYSQHKALSLYEDILGFFDTFVETYQGCEESLLEFGQVVTNPIIPDDAVEYLKVYKNEVLLTYRQDVVVDPKYGWLVNLIDSHVEKVNHAIYKLRFLA